MSSFSAAASLFAKHHSAPESPAPLAESETTESTKSSESSFNLSSEEFPSLTNSFGLQKGSNDVLSSPQPWGAAAAAATTTATPIASSQLTNGTSPRPVRMTIPNRSSAVSESIFIEPQQLCEGFTPMLLSSTLLRVKNKHSTSIESSSSKATGTITIIVKGDEAKVRAAKRELKAALCRKRTDTLSVPRKTIRHIIGPKGVTLNDITTRTLCQVTIPRDSNETAQDDSTGEDTVDVVLTGDSDGIAAATAAILDIVAEHTKNLSVRITDIEPRFYPFLSSALSPKLDELDHVEDLKLSFPTARQILAADSTPPYISISGPREIVLSVRDNIYAAVEKMNLTFGEAKTSIPRARHRFVLGDKGKNVQDLLETTGCYVSFPPLSSSDNTLVIFGPRSNLSAALERVLTDSSSLSVDVLDISLAYSHNVRHARDLARYFVYSGKLSDIESELDVQICPPPLSTLADSSLDAVKIEIVAKDAEPIKAARKKIVDLVNSIPPSYIQHIDGVNPTDYPQFITSKKDVFAEMCSQYGLSIVCPNKNDPARDMLLVYLAAPGSEFLPDPQQIADRLKGAMEYVRSLQQKLADFTYTIVDSIPSSDFKYIIGPKGATLNKLLGVTDAENDETDAYILLGKSNNYKLRKFLAANDINLTESSIFICGPESEVKRLKSSLARVIKEAKEEEVRNSYKVALDLEPGFMMSLIGRQGSNIIKLRTDFDCSIEAESGAVSIKGVKSNVEAARDEIMKQYKEFQDYREDTLSIPAKYYGALIGPKGAFVSKLEEKYGVRVLFPHGAGSDTASDGVSENNNRSNDDIVVQGASKKVAAAKKELLELYKYEAESSQSEEFAIPDAVAPFLIGRNGDTIKQLSALSYTTVKLQKDGESGQQSVLVTGRKEGIKIVKDKIDELIALHGDSVTQSITVPKKYHRNLRGHNGSKLREIIAGAGGDSKLDGEETRIIRVPPSSSDSEEVIISGKSSLVDGIIKAIETMVEDLKSEVTKLVDIAPGRRAALVGPGGSVRRQLEHEYSVSIDIPPSGSSASVKVSGKIENVDQAIAKMQSMAGEPSVSVKQLSPTAGLILSEDREFKNTLRRDYSVSVSFEGVRELSTEVSESQQGDILSENGAADPSSLTAYRWIMYVTNTDDSKVVMSLSGSDDNLKRSEKFVSRSIKTAEGLNAVGSLFLNDPSMFKRIVGAGGRTIQRIRESTGSMIDVPRNSDAKKPVVIRGSQKGVKAAKQEILAILSKE
ncbi:hypothetical protein CANCADRAFT_116405 [Tortispora caseinolytica NRRL Y-17796]|uniref:K Homology domain-containing protein n=1 Tax=Tortispora caseinolytica NRRL Y-17796 TaxID=767744 RepID=A0A1E4TH53_9ASCO|nr:hypothetical protein CANCADRAFT_116405 [Tortispora caseinolytica NRRL Y-17796]